MLSRVAFASLLLSILLLSWVAGALWVLGNHAAMLALLLGVGVNLQLLIGLRAR